MSDPIAMAKGARESLAKGLNALQADPAVPPHLVELAEPIAQAMGALHQIERTRQLLPHADVAAHHVRAALAALQAQPPTHPAVVEALEAVAASLGQVHALDKIAKAPPAPAPAPMPAAMPPQPAPAFPQTRTGDMPNRPANRAPTPPPQPQPVPQARYAPPPVAAQPRYTPAPMPVAQAQGQMQPRPIVAPDPFAQRDPFAPPPATPSMPVPAPPQGNLPVLPADLGTHSASNFYKGLSGNDVIDHGGLFVSTYVPPRVGTQIRLKISLPGGFEFEANAVVKWTREQGGDAPPGFGARITQISSEARQLIQRYVRNREPLFHDDL